MMTASSLLSNVSSMIEAFRSCLACLLPRFTDTAPRQRSTYFCFLHLISDISALATATKLVSRTRTLTMLLGASILSTTILGTMGCKQQPSTSSELSLSASDEDSTIPSVAAGGLELEAARAGLMELLDAEPPGSGKQLRDEGGKWMALLVQDFADSPDALELWARWLFLIGDAEGASLTWQQAIGLNPSYGYALHGLGRVAVLEGDYAKALDFFQNAQKSLPAQADVVLDLAQTYMKTAEITKVVELLGKYMAEHPPTAELSLLLGQAHLMERQFEEAKVAFERTLEISPNQPRAQQGLGTALVRLGRREEAKVLLEAQKEVRSVTERNRNDDEILVDEQQACSELYQLAAKLYLASGKVVQAEEILARAIVLDRQDLDAWRSLITLTQQQNSPALAAQIAERMCESNLENASCHYTLGVLKLKAGDVDASLAAMAEVIRLAPEDHTGYESLTRILVQLGQNPERALECAERNVAIKPTAAAHELLAQVRAVRGELEESIASLKRALELSPDNPEYLRSLEQLLQAQRKN